MREKIKRSPLTIEVYVNGLGVKLYTLPCLGRLDNGFREDGEIVIEIRDGVPHNAEYGDELRIVGQDELRGWDNLDGSTYVVEKVHNNNWSVDVPKSVIRHRAEHHGLQGVPSETAK